MTSEFMERHNISNLVDLLRHRAETQPDKTAYIFLVDGENEEVKLTYGQLDKQARGIAAELQNKYKPGERALLLYPPGLEFISAFFGCLYAGVIAVPCYPPDPNNLDVSIARLQRVIEDCASDIVLTTKEFLDLAEFIFPDYPDLKKMKWLTSDNVDASLGNDWKKLEIDGNSLAFLQYTSGSTGDPKGVMISHENLLSNNEMIKQRMGNTKETIIVGWLPIYHDMGLIGNILHVPYLDIQCVLMSPIAFLQKPMRWLKAISKYKATISSAPNFAYDLCVKKFSPEECKNLDFSKWVSALNGAEAVQPDTMKRFAETFRPYGFRHEIFYPAYGMAEATLMISGSTKEALPKIYHIKRSVLSENQITETESDDKNTVFIASCGQACVGEKIIIVDPKTMAQCSGNQIGEIWVSGPNAAQGYWNKTELTKETFEAYLSDTNEGPFLRTGDLGFMKDGELFVTGRLKDLIIIRGYNHYPQDIELTVEKCHDSLRPGCTAAFSVEVENEESLVVVQEIKTLENLDADKVIEAIRQSITEKHGLQCHAVVLIEARSIPKTSSGKIQRRLCRTMFLEGRLKVVTEGRLELSDDKGDATKEAQRLFLREILSSTESAVRVSLLKLYLQGKIAVVAGISPLKIDGGKFLGHFGLDSVKAMELKAEIEEDLKLELDLSEFVSGATIVELAEEFDRKLSEREKEFHPLPVKNVFEQSEYPLSYGQRGLYFEYLLNPNSAAYNIGLALKIKSEIDIEALESSLRHLMERHPQLLVNFVDKKEGVFQRINPVSEAFFTQLEASGLGEEELKNRVQEYHNRPFDLNTGHLCRFSLFSVSEKYHILLFDFHHIVFDGWSLWNFLEEFKTVYSAKSQNESPALTPLKHSYADYINWQKELLSGEHKKKLEDYWVKRLEGDLPVLELPIDHRRPAERTFNGATRAFRLSSDLTAKIKQLAVKEKSTPYTLFLAAYQTLLYRYSGQKKILTACPVAGRSRKEFFNTSGYFINMVVLTADFSENAAFRDFLNIVRQDFLEALRYQDYPFVSLVEKLSIKPDPARFPLVQTHFVLQSPHDFKELTELVSGRTINMGGLETEIFEINQTEGQNDLQLEMIETADSFLIELKYNTDLFKPDTIKRMATHFQVLLEGIVSNPDQKISQLPMMTESEKHKILIEWNDTEIDYPKDKCVHQLFEEQVEKTPDNIAMIFEYQSLTYAELNARANQLARHLRKLGVGPETLVGICMDRSLEMIIGLLGILKAGGAYLPLDPAYPKERLAYMLSDAGASVLLTQSGLPDVLPEYRGGTVCLDTDRELVDKESSENVSSPVTNENLAYVIYTSGSTGTPKGIGMSNGSLLNLLNWELQNGCVSESMKILQFAPISFDVHFQEIFSALCSGGRLILVSEDIRKDTIALLKLIKDREIEKLFLPFVALSQLAEVVSDHEDLLPASLCEVIIAGEQLKITPAIRDFFRKIPACRLINQYGPSETHVVSSFTLDKSVDEWPELPSIGTPVSNTRIHILDSSLNPVPTGVSGEIHIGGTALARGYLNRPELTAEKFIPDPFSNKPGSRLYRTGDQARYLPDGNIQFVGRVDSQVKIRGFRIESGEIEAVLTQHGAVKEAVVVAIEYKSADKRLAAYVCLKETRKLSSDDLRDFLKARLPDYMVPSYFVFLDALPLTPSGKIDRKVLPIPDQSLVREDEFVAPRNETEDTLTGIWAEVLEVDKDKISVFDNFFDLGGHSLLATQVVSRIRKDFGVEVSLQNFFAEPTVAKTDKMIESSKTIEKTKFFPISVISRKQAPPLSFAQKRLWFLDQLEGARSPTYNIPGAVEISGVLDIEALEKSLNEIISRHETLRTNFMVVNDEPLQAIHPDVKADLCLIDLSDSDESHRKKETSRLILQEARKPFDLSNDHLIRAAVLILEKESHVLLLTMHHIVSDGWSLGVFLRELRTLYSAFSRGEPSPLAELTIQYADFAYWQKQWLEAGIMESQLNYWQEKLSDPSLLELPTDKLRPAIQTFKGGSFRFRIDSALTADLNGLCRKAGVTMFMLLETPFAVLMSRYSGQTDILIGTPVANRSHSEVENLIGFFVNTLVIRNDLQGDPQFSELLDKTKRTALEAYDNQDVPFEKVVDALDLERQLSRSPLFQVMFAWQNAANISLDLEGLNLSLMETELTVSKFDLTLFMEEDGDEIKGCWEYSADLFDPDTIERMAGHFQVLLGGIVSNPDQKISELPILTEKEKHQILIEWNNTEADYPKDKCIHQLFEEQVEKTPDNIAVVFEDQSLTYTELNARANQLARHLRKLGVGPETLVGICMDRSLEMIIGLLGILKAGGAYLPLDPAYPEDRLAYMLNDSSAIALLTQAKLLDILPENQAKTVRLDVDWKTIGGESSKNMISGTRPDNLAYMIYTSGSTGKPKGVMIEHQGVINRLLCVKKTLRLTEEDRILQKTSFAFDVSVGELFLPLLSGACMVIAAPDKHMDSNYLCRLIIKEKITYVHFVPSALSFFLKEAEIQSCGDVLKHLWCGGEALSLELKRKFFDNCPQTKLYNGYGPTEASVGVTFCLCEEKNVVASIGRPISNTQIYILDPRLSSVPIGVTGELHIGGAGLARGYLNRPELTAEKFIANPFEPGSRIYKTGDLARWLPDGNIEFIGRMDHQVKIRGFRIEPGEIEEILCGHDMVSEAVVIAREDRPGDKRLAAYVCLKETCKLSSDDLRDFLKTRLPDYMIPSCFVFLDALPLTPSGKIDRNALPAPDQSLVREDEFVAPRNETEDTLTGIWAEVLEVDKDKISVFDNFFDLGGHSLLAVKLISQVQKRLRKQLSVANLFEYQTIQRLGEYLETKKERNEVFSPLVPFRTEGEKRPVFLIHYGSGDVFFYRHLVNEFDNAQPFYGLRAFGLEPGTTPTESVEEAAAKYLDAIRSVQPEGPYLIVGFCFGGIVAYEMARQLEKRGEYGMPIILNSLAPHLQRPPDSIESSVYEFIRGFWSIGGIYQVDILNFYCKRRDINPDDGLAVLIDDVKSLSEPERMDVFWWSYRDAGVLSEETDIAYLERVFTVLNKNGLAESKYTPKSSEDRLVIFSAEQNSTPLDMDDQPTLMKMISKTGLDNLDLMTKHPTLLGWDRYCDNIETHKVPGSHFSMLNSPHVQVLAKKIKPYLG